MASNREHDRASRDGRLWALIQRLQAEGRSFTIDVRGRTTLMVDDVTYALEGVELDDDQLDALEGALFPAGPMMTSKVPVQGRSAGAVPLGETAYGDYGPHMFGWCYWG